MVGSTLLGSVPPNSVSQPSKNWKNWRGSASGERSLEPPLPRDVLLSSSLRSVDKSALPGYVVAVSGSASGREMGHLAIYWHNQHFGMWIAPNPLPAQPMDTLLQLEWRFQRSGNTDMMLRIKRADLINAMTKAKAFWSAWRPGASAISQCGMFYASGDADFRYIIRLSTRGGIDNAESKDDQRGVVITLQRDAMPSAPMPKRKVDLRTSYEITITSSDFARLCAKLEV